MYLPIRALLHAWQPGKKAQAPCWQKIEFQEVKAPC
jgi:hypothetical protein